MPNSLEKSSFSANEVSVLPECEDMESLEAVVSSPASIMDAGMQVY